MAWYRCRHKGDGGVTPVGDATDGDVLSGKTYMNALGASTGTMTNQGKKTATLDVSNTSYTIPKGYHNGQGSVNITLQEINLDYSSGAVVIGPDSGKVISKVGYTPFTFAGDASASDVKSGKYFYNNSYTRRTGTFEAQAGSASPSTSSQTKYPDSGKYFNSFTVSAISPQRSNGTAASASGVDSAGPYVYFPYGWWPNSSSSRSYTYLTTAQAKAVHKHTDTWTPSSSQYNSSAADMGEYHSNRKVNTAVCYAAGQNYGGSRTNFILNNRASVSSQTNYSFSFTAETGYAYSVVVFLYQTSGGYTGVGSGANMTCSGASSSFIGGAPTWAQEEARSTQTSGNGGMVMRITGIIGCSAAGTVTVKANWVNTVSGALCYMVTGLL